MYIDLIEGSLQSSPCLQAMKPFPIENQSHIITEIDVDPSLDYFDRWPLEITRMFIRHLKGLVFSKAARLNINLAKYTWL